MGEDGPAQRLISIFFFRPILSKGIPLEVGEPRMAAERMTWGGDGLLPRSIYFTILHFLSIF